MLRVISLGAGVQSTTMALMAAHGELEPMPDAAIFADTGWEPKAVYEHLHWLMSSNVLPFPVHVVRDPRSTIREQIVSVATEGANGRRTTNPPFHVMNDKGEKAMLRRQCTRIFKVEPIQRKAKELLGIKRGGRLPKEPAVEQWLGISTDEATRMKPSFEAWVVMRWPLIEKRMSRSDCLLWLERHGYPRPPKSACIGCPYRNDESWRTMKRDQPEEFADAVEIDRMIRNSWPKIRGSVFLHSKGPLDEVDLRSDAEKGQLDMFVNECEGHCGV